MQYRHEWKHQISQADRLILRQRLSAVLSPDPHAVGGSYAVRSLYFDTPTDKALREKIDGVNRREKFRIRMYDGDPTTLHVEKKCKLGGLGWKESASLTSQEVQCLLDGEMTWMLRRSEPLLHEMYSKMQSQQLRPRTIVDYIREPYIYAPGNVRVTIDCDIRTSLSCTDFLSPHCITLPAGDAPLLLEVKWDDFLPAVVRDLVQLEGRRSTAFSKYAQCRIYG